MRKITWMTGATMAMALVLLTLPATAQTEIDETRPLDDSAVLSVDNISGSVKITGWNQEEVRVTGTLGKGASEVRISGDRSRMDIEVILPRHSRNVKPTHLEISVPRGCRLEVDTVSADIDVSDFDGQMDLESVSGAVTARSGAGEVTIDTTSGRITLDCSSTRTTLESVSGDIRLHGPSGALSVETVSGDMLVEGGIFTRISTESVSGNVQFDCGLASGARVEVDAHSGDVIFLLAGGLSAQCEVDTFSGNITNEFGPAGIENEYGPGKELEFTAGAGDGHVEINTFSGNVVLKQK